MNKHRRLFTTEEGKTNFIIFLIGLVGVLVGILAQDRFGEQLSTVFVSVGASLIASSVVSYISSVYLFKRRWQKEVTETWGLTNIRDNRSQINIDVSERFEGSVDNLDIIAYGLKSFRESKANIVREKLKRGMHVRILTVAPENELLRQKDLDEKKVKGSTADSILQLVSWCDSLRNETGGDIEVKFLNSLPTEVYFRIDNHIFVGPYQLGRESQRAITVEFSGNTKGYNYYRRYFDELWNDKDLTRE